MSDTRYSVVVEGAVRRYYDTADEALAFAKHAVYLAPERMCDMEALLVAGQIAEWSYGFNGVAVYPPEKCGQAAADLRAQLAAMTAERGEPERDGWKMSWELAEEELDLLARVSQVPGGNGERLVEIVARLRNQVDRQQHWLQEASALLTQERGARAAIISEALRAGWVERDQLRAQLAAVTAERDAERKAHEETKRRLARAVKQLWELVDE